MNCTHNGRHAQSSKFPIVFDSFFDPIKKMMGIFILLLISYTVWPQCYIPTTSTGNSIVATTTDIGNHCDDCETSIILPFSVSIFGTSYSSLNVSSNGYIRFAGSVLTSPFTNVCFPTVSATGLIAPLWDDLRTDAAGQGIFTSVSGSGPNRIFNIEWRAQYFSGGAAVNFEVRFYEGSTRIDFVYGTLNGAGSSATVGLQNSTATAFSQFSCNSASLSSGLMITWQQGLVTYYRDQDNDGYGDASVSVQSGCAAPAGYVAASGDCNDNDATIFPNAPEVCDSKDNDCDGSVDESCGSANVLVNNNNGAAPDRYFTQSESSILAFDNKVVIAFNDAGSNAVNVPKFTGWAYSTNGGASFTDGGTLPNNPYGDAGDPVLARNNTTGRIYLSTLAFNAPGTVQVFRSDDNAVTWMLPVNGTPGGSSENKPWIAVDNFAGSGNGNVYLMSKRYSGATAMFFFRSTDHGSTFIPIGGIPIAGPGSEGAYIAVGPDHSVYAFYYEAGSIMMRKSTNQGVNFGPPIPVVTGLIGGTNGDLGLTGIRNGGLPPALFRSNEFPHVAVNPVSGHLYVVYANRGLSPDKADVFFRSSTDGGTSWGPPVKVNDDVTMTDQWQPTIAVMPDGSGLSVFYYSRQEDPATNNLFKYYSRIATISG